MIIYTTKEEPTSLYHSTENSPYLPYNIGKGSLTPMLRLTRSTRIPALINEMIIMFTDVEYLSSGTLYLFSHSVIF